MKEYARRYAKKYADFTIGGLLVGSYHSARKKPPEISPAHFEKKTHFLNTYFLEAAYFFTKKITEPRVVAPQKSLPSAFSLKHAIHENSLGAFEGLLSRHAALAAGVTGQAHMVTHLSLISRSFGPKAALPLPS